MAMTKQEYLAKQEILKQLGKEGYPTYANLLDLFHVNLTSDPGVVAYMEPGKGRIVINRGLDIEQVSTIVRHEILHEYLNHHNRLINHIAKSRGLNPNDLKDDSIKEIEKELFSNQNFNIAGDYEISNRGYTERDKQIARNIKLNGQVLKGLVTEDDHPEWIDLSIEDMYDKLQQELNKEKNQAKQDNQQKQDQQGDDNQQGNGQSQQGQQSQDQSSQQQSGNGQQSDSGEQQKQDSKKKSKSKSGKNSDDNEQGNEQSSGQSGGGESEQQSSSSKKQPTIGDKGDAAKQEAEELEREANDITKELEKSDMASQELKDKAQDVADDASELSKDAKESGKGDSTSAQDVANDESINDRLEQIKRAFNDVKTQENALNEIENNIQKERAERSAKDLAKYRNSPIYKFTQSLNKFMKREVAVGKDNTWKRFNKKYQDSGIYKPGRAKVQNGKIPSINVYFDRSGSWGPEKTKVGAQAIGTLNNYVRKGQIKINLYYFSNYVHSDQESCYNEGGTSGQPIIDHIKKTNPDNIIIMTDADITDIYDGVTVPGVVWFLFKDGQSQNLIDNLHGRKATEIYDL